MAEITKIYRNDYDNGTMIESGNKIWSVPDEPFGSSFFMGGVIIGILRDDKYLLKKLREYRIEE